MKLHLPGMNMHSRVFNANASFMYSSVITAVKIQSDRQRTKQFMGNPIQIQISPIIQHKKKTSSFISGLVFLAACEHQPVFGPHFTGLVRAGHWHSSQLFSSSLTRKRWTTLNEATRIAIHTKPYVGILMILLTFLFCSFLFGHLPIIWRMVRNREFTPDLFLQW